ELEAHGIYRPARTFVLPVPLSRMVAPYTATASRGRSLGTAILKQRERIKRKTIEQRRLQYRKIAA
ncbi:MAG: hypothetical protein ACI856_000668, partial [Kiritimatiellia bacterium]